MTKSVLWTRLQTRWAVLSHYQRFEGFVALVLTLVIGLVILVALFRVVLLIALLAVARKFIVLDLRDVDAGQLLALAAITLALGLAYWLMRERDDRLVDASLPRAE